MFYLQNKNFFVAFVLLAKNGNDITSTYLLTFVTMYMLYREKFSTANLAMLRLFKKDPHFQIGSVIWAPWGCNTRSRSDSTS